MRQVAQLQSGKVNMNQLMKQAQAAQRMQGLNKRGRRW